MPVLFVNLPRVLLEGVTGLFDRLRLQQPSASVSPFRRHRRNRVLLAAGLALLAALGLGFRAGDWDRDTEVAVEPLVSRLMLPALTGYSQPVAMPKVASVERLEDGAFADALTVDVSRLGSVSIGSATRGRLFGGVHLGESELWKLMDSPRAWGTQETVSAIRFAVEEVNRLYPETHPLHIGHLSRRHGGWLRPHKSHRSGRDVDLGFYYLDESRWYRHATKENLDVERTWALLSALFKATPIEYIFVDRSLHPWLLEQARKAGEDPKLIQDVFEGVHPHTRPIMRHTRGHRNHLHIRFFSPVAVENGKRAKAKLGRVAWRSDNLLRILRQRQKRQGVESVR